MISERTRIAVLERDAWQCQQCGAMLERGIMQHNVHHLNYDGDRLENLVSLCPRCHKQTDHSNLHPPLLTNIQISKENREELKHFGKVGDTYDDVVSKLITLAKHHKNEIQV